MRCEPRRKNDADTSAGALVTDLFYIYNYFTLVYNNNNNNGANGGGARNTKCVRGLVEKIIWKDIVTASRRYWTVVALATRSAYCENQFLSGFAQTSPISLVYPPSSSDTAAKRPAHVRTDV